MPAMLNASTGGILTPQLCRCNSIHAPQLSCAWQKDCCNTLHTMEYSVNYLAAYTATLELNIVASVQPELGMC